MENTVYSILRAFRDIFFAFLSGVIPKLPDPIRYPLDFIGLTSYLEKSVNQSLREKKEKENEYLEYAKTIEKNRPAKVEGIEQPSVINSPLKEAG